VVCYHAAMSREFVIHTAIEFGPLTAFFVASFFSDFYSAAAVLVITTLLALITSFIRYRRFAAFSFFCSMFILVCGTATVYLHDPRWIVIEYTVSNLAFGVGTLGGWYLNRPVLRDLFGHMFLITERGWMLLTYRWGMCFLVTAVMNQLWWYLWPDENLWTLFRFVSTIAIFIFGMYQFSISRRERLPEASPWGLVVMKQTH
jgi:intracellular septation protein